MKNKLLVICGPTATGKTSLALSLAQKYQGELISADSRQVYKGMDIGTGKDIPKESVFEYVNDAVGGRFIINSIPLWGVDLVSPKEEFSISDFVRFARNIVSDNWMRGKIPILVGGTGFYIQGLIDGIDTIDIPQNKKLRTTLSKLSTRELFQELQKHDLPKASSLNESDQKNPVRLIRAIEVAVWNRKNKGEKKDIKKLGADTLYLGLTAPKEVLYERIENRVEERIELGLEKEIQSLLESGITWDMQAMNTLAYKEWRNYFEGRETKESVINEWIGDEKNYAKRQMTWFKKDKRISWFDITDPMYRSNIEKLVQTWHTRSNNF